jgi:CRP-like cAMP-binding protein
MENIIDLVLALKNVSIFNNIPDHVLADIAEIINVESIDKDHKFISKGDFGNEMYIIKTGSAKIHDGEQIIAILKENQIVGELAILAPVKRTADVTAIEDTIVFVINREYFSDLLSEQFEIVKGVMSSLVQTIILNNEKLKSAK